MCISTVSYTGLNKDSIMKAAVLYRLEPEEVWIRLVGNTGSSYLRHISRSPDLCKLRTCFFVLGEPTKWLPFYNPNLPTSEVETRGHKWQKHWCGYIGLGFKEKLFKYSPSLPASHMQRTLYPQNTAKWMHHMWDLQTHIILKVN